MAKLDCLCGVGELRSDYCYMKIACVRTHLTLNSDSEFELIYISEIL